MIAQEINYMKKFILFFGIYFFLAHILAAIFRFNRIPEWGMLIQGIILFLFLLYVLLWILTESDLLGGQYFCKIILLLIYISRAIIAIINEYYPILPNVSDVAYYHNLGVDFSREMLIQGSGIGSSAFGNYFIGTLYFSLGASPVIISIVNSFLLYFIKFYKN